MSNSNTNNETTEKKDKNNNSLMTFVSNILSKIFSIFSSIYFTIFKPALSYARKKMLWSISLLSLICFGILYYYIYAFDPAGTISYFSFTYFVSFFIILFFLLNLVLNPKQKGNNDNFKMTTSNIFSKSIRYFVILAVPFIAYFVFKLIYNSSTYLIGVTLKQSLILSISITLCILALIYNIFLRKESYSQSNKSNISTTFELLEDIIFFIPCLLIDIIEYFQNDYNNTSKTTIILGILLVSLILLRVLIPKIKSLVKDSNELYLLEECKELDKEAYYITEKDLQKKIKESDNILKKNMSEIQEFLTKLDEDAAETSTEYDTLCLLGSQKKCLHTCEDPSFVCFKENETDYIGRCVDKITCFEENDVNCTISQPVCTINEGESSGYCFPESSTVVETFNTIHALDRNISNETLISSFTDKEKNILEKLLSKEENNTNRLLIELSTNPKKLQEILKRYISQNEYYISFMNMIYTINEETNEFIDQQRSLLLATVNYLNGLNTYNYHYGLSFWVYLDTSLIQNNENLEYGVIMNYGNKPRMIYNYNKREINMEIETMEATGLVKSKQKLTKLYTTKNILFQRWNHFVLNYNYGTMDLFVNNNLVGTYKNISPYFDNDNDLSFGHPENTLKNCGICDIKYYKIPITLSKIQTLYKNGKK